MLSTQLPFQSTVIEFWQCVAKEAELTGFIIDHFLGTLASSCLYEVNGEAPDRQNTATHQPFAIFCALHELLSGSEIKEELKKRFADLFALFLTSIAVYTNLSSPTKSPSSNSSNSKSSTNSKTKFGFIPNKELMKMNPCQMIVDTFHVYLQNIGMEQLAQVLTVYPQLASCTDLNKFMELLTPMALALVGQLGITSTAMAQTMHSVGKYISSPHDNQRIAAVVFYSQIVPLIPDGELSSTIMQRLNSALADPNITSLQQKNFELLQIINT